jgi:hypothetical protein|nr:hypothetical protein [Trinickia soli]
MQFKMAWQHNASVRDRASEFKQRYRFAVSSLSPALRLLHRAQDQRDCSFVKLMNAMMSMPSFGTTVPTPKLAVTR